MLHYEWRLCNHGSSRFAKLHAYLTIPLGFVGVGNVKLTFEGVLVLAAPDPPAAAHFFEHTLGLVPLADDGPLRFYGLSGDLTVALDASGAPGDDACLLFSAEDIKLAAEHFVEDGCQLRELGWAAGAGFIARSAEGRSVAVVDQAALSDRSEGR